MNTSLVLAIVLGGSFGYVLQRIGVANPDNMRQMLSLQNLRLLKIIMLALGVSTLSVFILALIQPGLINFSVKASYIGVMVGGLIFGAGFAIGGYCPGTGLVATGTGRKDALIFVLGGLSGAMVFTLIYGAIKDTWLFSQISSGKVTLVDTGTADSFTGSMTGFLVALLIGVAFIVVSKVVKEKY